MNRLESLKVFVSLAETLHFKETANRLAVSPQVITRIINELENELGETLFQRSTRQVKLSDFGESFLPKAMSLLADADALFGSVKKTGNARIAGVVRIGVPDMSLMSQILGEVIEKAKEFDELRLDWQADLGLQDVVDKQIDTGIRFGTPEDSRLIIKKVGTMDDCIVASPALIERLGTPKTWQDLQKNYPLSALLNPNTGRAWAWYLSNEHQFMPNNPKFMASSMNDELIAVLGGLTLGCLPRQLCRPYLERGELIEIFPKIKRKQWTCYIYRPSQNVVHPRVKLVFDWLCEIMAQKLG